MPQLETRLRERVPAADVAVGFAIFVAGLFKKVMLADSLSGFVGQTFAAADAGAIPPFDSPYKACGLMRLSSRAARARPRASARDSRAARASRCS